MNLETVACIKQKYKQRVKQRAVDLIDSGVTQDICKVDVRLAGFWVYEMWERIVSVIIFNCWPETGIV